MRKIPVDLIKGGEILAKDIYTEMDTILMSAGTVIKVQYAERLKKLGIYNLYIEDDLAYGICLEQITEMKIKQQCQTVVKETLEKFSYCGDAQLKNLQNVAREIINDLLEQPEVIFNVEGMRKKSENIYAHSLNVCALSVFIALRMRLPRKKIDEIAVGSILHDIGYTYVPIEMQNMENDSYSEKEIKQLKMHVIHGYSAIEHENWLSDTAKNIVLCHHEKIDGSGFPFHLTSEKIGVEEKIVAVCDQFDRSVYGLFSKKMKVHEAIEYIVGLGGQKYDLEVVKCFNSSVAAYPNGTLVLTNDNDVGIVLRQNAEFPTRPVIRLIEDKNGKPYSEFIEKNLIKELTLFIKDTF
ncbi:HD-GYP domain-containing protein [Velocimicrobium porci]|uniref:HD domain-containing protein n=1 Tax=Velocimicrobium porci TaxID=2606634 RepID=A0A6L5XWF6_9FIRM|nr:HD domain-containing phosphohydrolase [Velocimicrobium porci]MSS62949.1 HD domain-containing protein [Velocimicrobium porci]